MACQVWDKTGKIHHVEIGDMESGVSAGLYFLSEPSTQEEPKTEPVKRGRKPKAVADENQE